MKIISSSIATRILLLVSLVTLITSVTIGWVSYNTSKEILQNKEIDILKGEVLFVRSKLEEEINTLKRDIRFLSLTPPIQGIIRAQKNNGIDPHDNSTEEEWKKRLGNIFIGMLKSKYRYTQIRFISAIDQGQEIIRVDRSNGIISKIEKQNLQNKKQHDYYKRAVHLNNSEVFISDINLNRELGKVQEPHTPVVRASTPIYDYEGNIFAVIVINQEFSHTTRELQKITPKRHNLFLTNSEGYYIYNKDRDKTFGFDLNNNHKITQEISFLKDAIEGGFDSDHWEKNDNNNLVYYYTKLSIDEQYSNRYIGVTLTEDYKKIIESSNEMGEKNLLIGALIASFPFLVVS